jgi:valyl-tRNA synthetase
MNHLLSINLTAEQYLTNSEQNDFPKRYNPSEIEAKWQQQWLKPEVYATAYRFHKDDTVNPIFSIDTPPPFTSGEMHMGQAYWTVINDTLARYKRMRGFNVLLPQGWDCQGLPTELKVQNRWHIPRSDRDLFRQKCVEYTQQMIVSMKSTMIKMGYRPDWEQFEYRTMDQEYWRRVQDTLLKLFEKGLIYRGQSPVHWCPSCETALAQAEVGYVDVNSSIYYVRFRKGEKYVEVATTRPELIGACQALAVNPEDERYKELIGGNATVPIYEYTVPILGDSEVDMEFGTGAVMVCTFGDEQDIRWQKRYSLAIRRLIDERGRLINSGKYDGMSSKEARRTIVEDLLAAGLLSKQENISHKVLSHTERSDCMSPVEFLVKTQFFIKIIPYKEAVIEACRKMEWVPDFMLQRLEDWVNSIEWDWLISRQRVYGTPIPFWYCDDCEEIIPPAREQLPVVPECLPSPVEKCPKCGSKNIKPSLDVCDCWIDSSITSLLISGYFDDCERFGRMFPTTLRQQGHDIIRTWLFYTTLRSLLLTGEQPFRTVLVNGHILGPDGSKMSKSKGNVVSPEDKLAEFGADSMRQAVLSLKIGSDFPFKWEVVRFCKSFLQKYWSSSRFASQFIRYSAPPSVNLEFLETVDHWILGRLSETLQGMTAALDSFQFHVALELLQSYLWHDFCDQYLEAVKHRLYSPRRPEELEAAKYTLNTVLLNCTLMLAPFCPHVTDEIYHDLFDSAILTMHSLKWPRLDSIQVDANRKEAGSHLIEAISLIRNEKSKTGMSLNTPLENVIITGPPRYLDVIRSEEYTVKSVLRIQALTYENGEALKIVIGK